MRHPSEYFIKFLMLQPVPEAQYDDWIQKQVMLLDLPRPDVPFLAALRSSIYPPIGFEPSNRLHLPSVKYLKDQKVYGLFHPDKPVLEANTILTDLRCRPAVEKLLLAAEPFKVIAKQINGKFGTTFTGDGVESYSHYYWNTKLLRPEDWGILLEGRVIERETVLSILKAGPEHAYRKAGFQVALESKSALQKMSDGLLEAFEDTLALPYSINKVKALVGLSAAMAKLDMQLSQGQTDLKKTMSLFEKMKIDKAKVEATPIRELAEAGNFSRSGVNLVEAVPNIKDLEDDLDESLEK